MSDPIMRVGNKDSMMFTNMYVDVETEDVEINWGSIFGSLQPILKDLHLASSVLSPLYEAGTFNVNIWFFLVDHVYSMIGAAGQFDFKVFDHISGMPPVRSAERRDNRMKVDTYALEIEMLAKALVELCNFSPGSFQEMNDCPRKRREIEKVIYALARKVLLIFDEFYADAKIAVSFVGREAQISHFVSIRGKGCDYIEDQEAKTFWSSFFRDAFIVSVEEFLSSIEEQLDIVLESDLKVALSKLVDYASCKYMSVYTFNDLVNAYGSLERMVVRLRGVLLLPYFHSFVSLRDAVRLLAAEKPGTFMLRRRDVSVGALAVAFIDPKSHQVVHVAINCSPNGYAVQNLSASIPFETIDDFLTAYRSVLQKPFTSTLNSEPWFYGDTSGRKATEYLTGKNRANYLVRFSQTSPNCLATAFVRDDGMIVHALIEKTDAGYHHGEDPPFPTITKLIQAYQGVLTFPYIRNHGIVESISERARKKIAAMIAGPNDSQGQSTKPRSGMTKQPLIDRKLTSALSTDTLRVDSRLTASGDAKVSRTEIDLPAAVEQSIYYLAHPRHAATADIFVKSGSTSDVQVLLGMFSRGIDVDLWVCEVPIVAQLLKVYLREMPEPLLPEHLFHNFLVIFPETPYAQVMEMLQQMPALNAVILKYLLAMLRSVMKVNTEATVEVLAEAFGPNVIRKKDMKLEESLKCTEMVNRSMVYLITNADKFYPDVDGIDFSGIDYGSYTLQPNRLSIRSAELDILVRAVYEDLDGCLLRSSSFGAQLRLTYRSFMTVEDLFSKLFQAYQREELEAGTEATVKRQKIVSFIAKMMRENEAELRASQAFLMQATMFVDGLADLSLKGHVSVVLERIKKPLKTPPPLSIPRGGTIKKLKGRLNSVLDIPMAELAKQITEVMSGHYNCIKPTELMEVAWQKGSMEERQKNAGNVLAVSTYYNHTVFWIVSEILRAKNKAKAVHYFTLLASELHNLANFNGLFAILTALQQASIARLNEVKHPKKKDSRMAEYARFMATTGSWKNYRNALRSANPPLVPYLGVFQTDLLMIHEGNKLHLPNGHINFRKCTATSMIIQHVQTFQNTNYNFPTNLQITSYIDNYPVMTEDEAWEASKAYQA